MSHVLFRAAEKGDAGALESLLAGGANIEWTHKGTGRTALVQAAINGHRDAVAVLLRHGAAIDHQCTAMGYTALSWAASKGLAAIVGDLIAAGAAIDIPSPEIRHTPLMLAAQAGEADIVSLLLKAGANPNLLDFRRENAWSLARGNARATVVSLLEQAGGGPPPPAAPTPTLPWPEVNESIPATDDPVRVVFAYISAMHAWEQSGNARRREAASDPAFWAGQLDIVARFCTHKPRAYAVSSFGTSPSHSPADKLLAVTMVSASKAEIVTLHQDVPEYEHCFTVRRKGSEWRIDSLKERMRGGEKWRPGIL